MAGQIKRGTLFAETIFKLSLISEFKNYVEIGTWNGQGSTRCFMDGILMRRDMPCLWSLEANKKLYIQAWLYWSFKLAIYRLLNKHNPFPQLKLIHGRITEISELPSIDEIQDFFGFSREHFLRWYKQDIKSYENCSNVLDQLPRHIDVLLLDGGEYSTYAEFRKLKDRTDVILLDDTEMYKCRGIKSELKQDKAWETIIEVPTERNGIYVGCKKSFPHIKSLPKLTP